MGQKILIVLLIIICVSSPVTAKLKLDRLLTTEGLNESGNPVTVKNKFSLAKDKGVQYYVKWNSDKQDHDVAVRWFGPQERLINFLYLPNFSKNIVRDYISFKQETKTQYYIPQHQGKYSIYLYIDQQLIAVTKFKINN